MKEIGGYFGLEIFTGNEFYSDLIAVNSGRSALLYILKARNIRKLYIPYLLCDSVSEMCKRENVQYSYYHIDADFMPVFDRDLEANEYIYIVNFYGFLDEYKILSLKERYKQIICDNAHAFFQRPVRGVDTIYTCRKFFGVSDGGYVSSTAELNEKLEIDMSMGRMTHILGRFEENATMYYSDFKRNENEFMYMPLRYMSKITHNLMLVIDYEMVKKKREENFRYLNMKLKKYNKLSITNIIGPYAYPFYMNGGMDAKKKLAEKNIYVATLWPNVLELDGTIEKGVAENILPLPCDQRYTIGDMEYMVDILLDAIGVSDGKQ